MTPTPTGSSGVAAAGRAHGVPDGVRVGSGDVGVPGRGLDDGGRARAVDRDTFAATPGKISDGSTGDPAADHDRLRESDLDLIADRAGRVPVLGRVARIQPTAPGRSTRPVWTSTGAWWTGCWNGGSPGDHALPWEFPAGAAGRRRVAGPRHGGAVRGVRGDHVRGAAGRRRHLADHQRAEDDRLRRHRWGAHAPGSRTSTRPPPPSTTSCSGHGRAVEAFRASGAAGGIGIALNLLPVYPASPTRTRRRCGPTPSRTGCSWTRSCSDGIRRTRSAQPGQLPGRSRGVRGTGPGRRPGGHQRAPGRAGGAVLRRDRVDDSATRWAVPEVGGRRQQVHPEGLYDQLIDPLIDYPTRPRSSSPRTASRTRRPRARRTTRSGSSSCAHLQQAARAIDDGVGLVGLLRVVAARQLRVGRGDEAALAWSTSTSTPRSDPQGEHGVVLVGGPRERGGAP